MNFVSGCLLAQLTVLTAWGGVNYSGDIRPILQKHCTNCHKAGEIGPMPLESYTEVRPWAAAIQEAVATRTMPPWHATANTAHPYRNDRSLSREEISAIEQWVAAGAPAGAAVKETTARQSTGTWKLGAPNLTVEVPGFEVPASGQLPYSFLIVPLHLDHDVWVRAAEFRIDQRAVIHHMNAFVRPPGSSFLASFPKGRIFVPTVAERGKRRDNEAVFDRRELLLGYEPGYEPGAWLEGAAKLVKAGSDLVFEMHYNPNGKPAVDHSQIALYFAETAPAKRILAIDTLRDLDLQIPPGAGRYESKAAMTLAGPAMLLSVQPHMHMRGAAMAVQAVLPGGQTIPLTAVPRYDFHWQTTYTFREPVKLPAGTRLESVARFDNSANNAFNPDPAKTVRWGDQTTDEMHIAFLELVIDAKADVSGLLAEKPKMIGQQ